MQKISLLGGSQYFFKKLQIIPPPLQFLQVHPINDFAVVTLLQSGHFSHSMTLVPVGFIKCLCQKKACH